MTSPLPEPCEPDALRRTLPTGEPSIATPDDRMRHAMLFDVNDILRPGVASMAGTANDWQEPRLRPDRIQPTMQSFNAWLALADIADIDAVDVPGAYVLLPWGVRLAEHFAVLVRALAALENYPEVAFPHVVRAHVFDPVSDLVDAERALLKVGDSAGRERLVLSPTGEQQVYTYWARSLRAREHYPARVFQRTRYFRPTSSHRRSGGGVFKSLEAVDVFEFHGCDLAEAVAESASELLSLRLAGFCARVGVPMIWSARPPWTNNGHLYSWCAGGDALLPSGQTVQVSGAYFQAQKYSRRFDIGVGRQSSRDYAWQHCGFVTRRLMWAALFNAAARGTCLHPIIAPVEAVVLATDLSSTEAGLIASAIADTGLAGRRVHAELSLNKQQLNRQLKLWTQRKTPLVILIFGSGAGRHDVSRCVAMRGDSGRELQLQDLTQVGHFIPSVLEEIAATLERGGRLEVRDACASAQSLRQVARTRDEAKIAVAPIVGNERCIRALESEVRGEILGLTASLDDQACVVSGELSRLRAIIAPRL